MTPLTVGVELVSQLVEKRRSSGAGEPPPPTDDDAPPTTNASDEPQSTRKRWHRFPELVDVIMSRASEPWAQLTIGNEELVRVRAGGYVVVMGPTGGGKTSLVAALAIEHARNAGPVVAMSRELPADEFGARAIGMQCDAGWEDVLRGRVEEHEMRRRADLPRVFIADRKDATLPVLVQMIRAAQEEYPGQLVLAVVDYVQIVESKEGDPRAKVSDVIQQIDDILREHRCAGLLISQMSRAASRAARSGDAMGADSTDGGAESGAIERTASVTLSIGQSGPECEDGSRTVDLSIGKGRMSGGDQVVPMTYWGKSGRWRIAGAPRPAAEVRAERQDQSTGKRVDVLVRAIPSVLDSSDEPMSRRRVTTATGARDVDVRAAIKILLAAQRGEPGDAVEVGQLKNNAYKLWTRRRAELASIPIVPSAIQQRGQP